MSKTLLLLSGGLDSSALAYLLRPSCCMVINYGQNAADAEIESSLKISNLLNIQHVSVNVPIRNLGTGTMSKSLNSHNTYTPEFWAFRNQFLITIASMYAMKNNFTEIQIGTVSSDKKRHKDGTKEFIELIDKLTSMQEGNIRITAPAQSMTSIELIRTSNIPPSILAWAHSCHISNIACGQCNGCIKQSETLSKLGWNR